MDQGDFEMATKILNTRIRLEPSNHEFYFERAICHHKLGNYQASLDDTDEAIRLNPSDFNIHCQRGLALCGLTRLNEAITSFKKAIELRARQQDSKLSDIFYILKVAADETKAAKEKSEANRKQTQIGATSSPPVSCGPTNFRDTSELIHRQESKSEGLNDYSADSSTEDKLSRTVGSTTDPPDETPNHKRVMVTPSSSMPATGQNQATISNKEDSYSSKYKRLRRDRERARRGTSKLCTIKPADLEELKKLSKSNSDKKSMRVIAPIDGWLYSGQLSFDSSNQQDGDEELQYVVKLDGDTSGSSYLFNQETVLNDVIKEVRVKSVSELRKGARICCYWSRTYKCLSTGVVTSRTFEATKSLVSVKYDNGDLSALPLEDLRLLPPDYPKYMSNCDPLLLANAGDQTDHVTNSDKNNASCRSIVIDGKSSNFSPLATYSRVRNVVTRSEDTPDKRVDQDEDMDDDDATTSCTQVSQPGIDVGRPTDSHFKSPLDDETIPPTRETIEFITSETNLDIQDEDEDILDRQSGCELEEDEVPAAKLDNSRASSEENNYGVEYRPWVFQGPSKRIKRNGRIYRDTYSAVRRGNEILKVGDSAELMPRDESIMPFIAKIDGLWANSRGEMRVRTRWYYRLAETGGDQYELEDGDNALFETDHFDENDVQSIWRTTKILSWTEYCKEHIGHVNKPSDGPKIFYLAGFYDPRRQIKHLRSDVKGLQ